MSRLSVRLAALAVAAIIAAAPIDRTIADTASAEAAPARGALTEIQVTAQRLDDARSSIETQTGASTYKFDETSIATMPGGDNNLLNQVVLRAPDVAQDSFGQFHVRGEHNGLQYRLNGIVLPEGISVFGQSLDPKLISSMKLITGALPAEYGLRTAGIIDLATKNGQLEPGGSLTLYGGSHSTIEPSVNYGGSSGNNSYFLSGDFLRNDLGIESPDGSSQPIHDHTTQYHGFGMFEHILDDSNRITVIVATSTGKFQIPNRSGLQPSLGLTVSGRTAYPSASLDENQREVTHFAIASLQHSAGDLNVQTSLTGRYSALTFVPDPLGDLLYNGVSQQAYKRNTAFDWQSDGSLKLNDVHTLRAGFLLQRDRSSSETSSLVLAVDATGAQTSDVPLSISDNGAQAETIESVYLQDEWKLAPTVIVNYGLRIDNFSAYTSAGQVEPRINALWTPREGTTIHGGYSRYLSPPPFELVGNQTIAKFVNTTGAPAVTQADSPKAERANYYDLGVQQQVGPALVLGVDSYYKQSTNLIDEGQFGAPIILTPFNYRWGEQYGMEFTAAYAGPHLSTYANLALQSAKGKQFTSAQFNFSPDDLVYVNDHYIHLDHEQRVTGSGGASYRWSGTTVSTDLLYGYGLRASLARPDGSAIPNGTHLPVYWQTNAGATHVFRLGTTGDLTARFDLINVFDNKYEIRNGTGVGVGAPQYGPRRGLFFGLSVAL